MLTDVCRELHYLNPVPGKALVGHIITTVKVNYGDQCEIKCYGELECLSYNLGPHQVDGHACELSKSDHIRHPDDLVPMAGYTYKGTEVHDMIHIRAVGRGGGGGDGCVRTPSRAVKVRLIREGGLK